MAFKLVDRVRETTISPGTGTATLAGAALGYQTFSAGVGANNTTYYVIADQSGANWEVGYGTVGAGGTTLARTTVLSSSNAGSLVNFASGTQDVWVDYPATKAVFQDSNGNVAVTYNTSGSGSIGSLNVGGSLNSVSDTGIIASFVGTSSTYVFTALQNKTTSATSYSSYALYNDLGTVYGEIGMNSSTYLYSTAGFPNNALSTANAFFLEAGSGAELVLGTYGLNGIHFLTNGNSGTVEAMTINSSNAVGFNSSYGTSGQVLTSGGSSASPTWGVLGAVGGGTGQSTVTTGDLLYGSATNTWSKLGIGSTGTILRVVAGIPAWGTDYTGTVTSVAQSFTGGLISVSGSPITTSGTFALTVAGTSGGIPYFSSASTWASSALLAANALMVGGGAGVAPSTVTTGTGVVTALGVAVGSAGAFVVNGGALGTPSSGTLTNCTFPTLNQNTTGTASNVTGTVAVANGGTGLSAVPANGALNIGNGSGFTRATLTAGNYINITNGAGSITINNTAIYSASYLVVAGGGGGGADGSSRGGGGGAGGLLAGTTLLSVGVTYTATVGAGGSAPNQGSNSSFATVTAIGGGAGGSSTGATGGSGGSGGGGGQQSGAGGSGTSGQGNSGGNGGFTNGGATGGGGGGASAAGISASGSTVPTGGAGTASSITGSSVTYAGGGGGGAQLGSSGGFGGAGGGGIGFNQTGGPSAGSANTGGGGGGGSGQSGGSGVVIISVPTINYTGTTTGSPTVTTSGSNTIIKFTSSGTYTA